MKGRNTLSAPPLTLKSSLEQHKSPYMEVLQNLCKRVDIPGSDAYLYNIFDSWPIFDQVDFVEQSLQDINQAILIL